MSNLSCSITGHNPQRFKFKYNEEAPLCRSIKAAVAERIKRLYCDGVRRFCVGCAVGVDTWAAEIIIDLKKQSDFSDIELFCAIPFPGHDERFTEGQKKRYQNILSQSTDKEIISRHYSPTAYKRLNYYLIDNSGYLIAVYDQDKSSNESRGLIQMVNYGVKSGCTITFIHPDTAEVSEHI